MASTATLLSSAKTLSATATASTSAANVSGFNKHTLYVSYTPATNSTNAMVFTVEVSPDGTNWYPFTGGGGYSAVVGAATPSAQLTVTLASAGTTAQYHPPLTFECPAKQVRIKASESNTPANYGAYTATLFSRDA
jgi:hypothetical protein